MPIIRLPVLLANGCVGECRLATNYNVTMTTRLLTPDEAIGLIPAGARVITGPCSGAPVTLLQSLAGRSADVGGIRLFTGLQYDPSPFLPAVAAGTLGLTTWHVAGAMAELVGDHRAEYIPARLSEVPHLLASWNLDVAIVRVTPPDRFGFCNVGPSPSYSVPAIEQVSLVIGEIDETLPRTLGQSTVHVSRFAAFVEAQQPTPEYHSSAPDAVARRIAAYVLDLLPERPTLQMGIGSIPEAVTEALGEAGATGLRFVGMASDALAGLFERGALDITATMPTPAIVASEIMGTSVVMRFVDANPLVGAYPSTYSHSPAVLGQLDRFVSINSAVEVDLSGQVNSEMVNGRHIAGVGGSVDYVESAFRSFGGLRIIAMTATAARGKVSRIVTQLDAGVPVTISRTAVDAIVTEYGVARLRGRSLSQRRDALIAIAHPDHRAGLAG